MSNPSVASGDVNIAVGLSWAHIKPTTNQGGLLWVFIKPTTNQGGLSWVSIKPTTNQYFPLVFLSKYLTWKVPIGRFNLSWDFIEPTTNQVGFPWVFIMPTENQYLWDYIIRNRTPKRKRGCPLSKKEHVDSNSNTPGRPTMWAEVEPTLLYVYVLSLIKILPLFKITLHYRFS
jgi:hypothetical protein